MFVCCDCCVLSGTGRPVFTHGPPGGKFSGAAYLKKSRLKYGMRKKKALHEREI